MPPSEATVQAVRSLNETSADHYQVKSRVARVLRPRGTGALQGWPTRRRRQSWFLIGSAIDWKTGNKVWRTTTTTRSASRGISCNHLFLHSIPSKYCTSDEGCALSSIPLPSKTYQCSMPKSQDIETLSSRKRLQDTMPDRLQGK